MEYAKEEVLEGRYNEERILKEIKLVKKVGGYIKKHKFISTMIISLCLFSTLNIIMIYNFMRILQSI